MEAGILLIFGRIPALFSGLPAVGSGRKDERKHTSECFLSLFFPDFITFLRHHIAHNDNQRVT